MTGGTRITPWTGVYNATGVSDCYLMTDGTGIIIWSEVHNATVVSATRVNDYYWMTSDTRLSLLAEVIMPQEWVIVIWWQVALSLAYERKL